MDRIADPARSALEAIWETDFRETMAQAAMQRVKEKANLKDCQMFDLYVLRGWPVREVARALGVGVARAYLAKHRIGPLVRKQIEEVEKELV